MADPQKEMLKAAKTGNAQRIKELLAASRDLLGAIDKDGSTPLHCAVWKGHIDAVRVLLEAGADVNRHNQNDHWGTTPLHAAAHANQSKIAELLIEYGADLDARDLEGRKPLFHTTFHNAKATARIIEKHS